MIKVVSIVDPCESTVAPITTCNLRKFWKILSLALL